MLLFIDPKSCFGHKANPNKVKKYYEELMNGSNFPPIEVVKVEDRYIILDGVHRTQAHLLLNEPVLAFVYDLDDCPKLFLAGAKIGLKG